MKIDPNHLMQLAAIVEYGGFTKAANSLGMTQPALSRTIINLEKRLNAQLFSRRGRPLQATPIAFSLAEQGRAILAATKIASDNVELIQSGTMGAIRVAGPQFFMDALVSGLLADYRNRYPEVRIDQRNGYPTELIALIRNGEIDVAICPIDRMTQDSDIEFTPLMESRNIIACRGGHPLLPRRDIVVRDLLDYDWIEPPARSPLLSDFKSAFVSMGAESMRIGYTAESTGSVLNYLKRSDCLTVLPYAVVFAHRHSGDIMALPMKLDHPRRQVGLLRSKHILRTPTVDRFTTFIADRFAEMKDLIRRHENIMVWGR